MNPQIDFTHVLSELSVNRTDSCEVLRELVSNSYDANAKALWYAPLSHYSGFIFADDGDGLSTSAKKNGITPYEAFFSIGKSTKTKGEAIGYKCQGSKLLFASTRVLIITRTKSDSGWLFKAIENPRSTLTSTFVIDPESTDNPESVLNDFCTTQDSESNEAIAQFDVEFFAKELRHGTFICVQKFDANNFGSTFLPGTGEQIRSSYLFNYLRYYTKHGDTRAITEKQGFKKTQVAQVKPSPASTFRVWDGQEFVEIPFGFPYLDEVDETDVKSPLEVSRLRDGNFSARFAKRITTGGKTYCFVLCVDGNRRAHKQYESLDRKGGTKSGIRLTDQRGVCLSVNGIRVTRYPELFSRPELSEYETLADTEAITHYLLMIDGPFDLVTNRNAVSKSSTLALEDGGFLADIKKFLDEAQASQLIFKQLIARLKKEQSDAHLEQQMQRVANAKAALNSRERFRIEEELFVSPESGEEYLVGVLYAALRLKVAPKSAELKHWIKILTFSTLGIDSVGTTAGTLDVKSAVTVEYKYQFSAGGPFNHALATVNWIVAWSVDLPKGKQIRDDYGCFGDVVLVSDGVYEIQNIEHVNGASYDHTITVLDLRKLIHRTFPKVKYTIPPKS